MLLFIEQALNGLQYGAMLFMLASGLTLIFGIMGVINLTHGAFYMVGAYCAAYSILGTGSFLIGMIAAILGAGIYAIAVELSVIQWLYKRDHLYQVLATLGLILFTNEAVSMIFGRQPPFVDIPSALQGTVSLLPGLDYPIMRLAFIIVGASVAVGLWLLVNKTYVGMLIRAGADDREMVDALGVNVRRLYTLLFGLGGALCGLAGVMTAPLLAIEIGMGERVLITTFVVIVIGGIGSIKGALVGALLVGMVDSMGRAYLPELMRQLLPPSTADMFSAGLVSASIYVLMAIVLLFRPLGLMPARS